MRTVKSDSGFTFRLNRASMTEIWQTDGGKGFRSKRPYRMTKKELIAGLNGQFLVAYYIRSSRDEYGKCLATVEKSGKSLRIGCMFFSPAETKKLIKWAKEVNRKTKK
jgi:hypothetical protein